MTIATTLLTTAHTLGQVRRASRAQCVGMNEARDPKGTITSAEYRFGDSSMIIIKGKKISIGQWVYRQTEVIHPSLRVCTAPDCWACDGTGITDGKPCTMNDAIPF